MKTLPNIVSFFLILLISCGNADESDTATLNSGTSGAAEISIDGEPIEITSVSCEAEEYNYLVEASGPDHSLEIAFSEDRMDQTDEEYDFRRANHIEIYIYGSESTITYRGKRGSEPGFDISGSETHAEGTVEVARYNDTDDVLTIEVDIRCEA